MDSRNAKRLKAALTGAFVCGLVGPTIGALAILGSQVARDPSTGAGESLFGILRVLPWVLPIAIMLVGPEAFVMGGVGALIIQVIGARAPTRKALFLQIAALGVALGGAVPFVADAIGFVFTGSWNKNFATGLLPLGGITGVVCAAATYWLLRRTGLLLLPAIP